MYSSIDILFKLMIYTLSILQSDHMLITFILLFLALIPVMSLFLIVLLLLQQLRPFPHFQLFIILQFTLLYRLFFSHIPFQTLLLLSFITLFPLKILFGSLLIPSLPLSIHSFSFGLGEQLQTSDSKQTCIIVVLLPSFQNLLYHNISHSPIFFITFTCLTIISVRLISRH